MNRERLSGRKDFRDRVEKDPFGCFLGIKIYEVETGYAKACVKVREEFQNFSGYVQSQIAPKYSVKIFQGLVLVLLWVRFWMGLLNI